MNQSVKRAMKRERKRRRMEAIEPPQVYDRPPRPQEREIMLRRDHDGRSCVIRPMKARTSQGESVMGFGLYEKECCESCISALLDLAKNNGSTILCQSN